MGRCAKCQYKHNSMTCNPCPPKVYPTEYNTKSRCFMFKLINRRQTKVQCKIAQLNNL